MAKARLRDAAADIGVRPWIRHNPVQAIVIAATSGFVIGRKPDLRNAAAISLIRGAIRALVQTRL
jgi:hypothetical protein